MRRIGDVVRQKAEQRGADVEGLEHDLEALGVEFRPFDVAAARATADRWHAGAGLSLGDRACLALASEIDGVAMTADRRWRDGAGDVRVRTIR